MWYGDGTDVAHAVDVLDQGFVVPAQVDCHLVGHLLVLVHLALGL